MSDHDSHEVDRQTCVAELKHFLDEARDLRLAAVHDGLHGSRRLRLRAWQAARLAKTHADLLASPRFGIAAEFFLTDLYGPKDFSERDAEVERILPVMTSMLPVSGLRTLLLAVEVDALSERFDARMVEVLGKRLDKEDGLSSESYASAYRRVGDRAGRELQIRLIGETGEALDALSRKTIVRGALKMMHGPAQMAGLGELHAFLQRGFDAFRSMREADEFLETIISRERATMRALLEENQ